MMGDSNPHAEPWNEKQVENIIARDTATKKLPGQDAVVMRQFATGATRNTDDNKPDYEGFISPLVTQRFGRYMHKHRFQADGKVRASDNWQKGIPIEQYLKSGTRHWEDVRLIMDGYPELATEEDLSEALCAMLFNVSGMLFELQKNKLLKMRTSPGPEEAIIERCLSQRQDLEDK
jgi:hypothetical protein